MVEDIQDQIDETILSNLREELYKLKGKILLFLKENKNNEELITADDIQREFKIKKSTASEYLCALEKDGLIKRKSIGKFKSISITELGESFV